MNRTHSIVSQYVWKNIPWEKFNPSDKNMGAGKDFWCYMYNVNADEQVVLPVLCSGVCTASEGGPGRLKRTSLSIVVRIRV